MTKENLIINLEANFWEINPFFIIPFSKIYNEDKSKNKADSSKLMWTITLLKHHDSPLSDLPEELKWKEIYSWWLTDKLDLSPYEEDGTIERFISLTVKWGHYYLNQWRKKLEERDEFINSTPYNASSYELLEKLLGNSKKIWDQYLMAEKEAEKDTNEGSVKGDIQESATELGLI